MIRTFSVAVVLLLSSQLGAQDANNTVDVSPSDPIVSVRTTLSYPAEMAPAIQPYVQCIFAARNSLIGQRISADSPEYREVVLEKCAAERAQAVLLAKSLVREMDDAGSASHANVAATFDDVENTILDVPEGLSSLGTKRQ